MSLAVVQLDSPAAQWRREQEAEESKRERDLKAFRRAELDLLREIMGERDPQALKPSSWWKGNSCPICRLACASRKELETHKYIHIGE